MSNLESTPEKNIERVRRILEKLEQVRKQRISCFGSEAHGFQLNPPISEKELVQFETTHQIRLPEDYRCFLTLAGNGGAGPFYGLYKLEQWDDFLDWSDDIPDRMIVNQSCPLRPDMSRTDDWRKQFPDVLSPYQGTISIGTQGCTYLTGLIVTGQFAGRVVYLDVDDQAPYVIREPDFLAWYDRWLNELLGNYDMHRFGFGLGGDEKTLLKVLDRPDATTQDRVEAIDAISRLPELRKTQTDRIFQWLEDESAEIRAAALAVANKFQKSEVTHLLPHLLNDKSAKVQTVAIDMASTLPGLEVKAAIYNLLFSSDSQVAQKAFFCLQKHEQLSRLELKEVLLHSPHGSLRYFAANAFDWQREDEDLLIRLLQDEHSKVRFYASLGLRKLKSQKCMPAVIDMLARETDEHAISSMLHFLGEVSGPSNADILLRWTHSEDDFYRLDAINSLCTLGDERVTDIASAMLKEKRSPVRQDLSGLSLKTHQKSIAQLVRESLQSSRNRNLRSLAGPFAWLKRFLKK